MHSLIWVIMGIRCRWLRLQTKAPYLFGDLQEAHKTMEKLKQVSAVKVRLAHADEASLVSYLLYTAFKEYKPLYTLQGFALTTPTEEQIRRRWKEGPVWLASSGQKIVGTVSVVPRPDCLYLRSMAVLPIQRGSGIGTMLLEEVLNYAKINGFKIITLSTTPFLHQAIRLYERFGFITTDKEPHDLAGTPLITMEKLIGKD